MQVLRLRLGAAQGAGLEGLALDGCASAPRAPASGIDHESHGGAKALAEQITQQQKAQEPVIPAQLGVQTNRKIEDHALIGNMRSAALVARDGTIDWLCLPDFDSDACFASLLRTEENGEWALAPRESIQKITRRYRKDTLILETEFTCASGSVRLIDFMPVGQEFPRLVRTIVGVKGTVAMHSKLTPRFAFGRSIPRVESVGGSV